MKKILFMIVSTLVLTTCVTSCGGNKSSNDDSTSFAEKDTVSERTITIPFLSALPIEGDDASYFEVTGEDDTENVVVIGTPDSEDVEEGTIRAKVKIDVKKQFKNLKGFARFPVMPLYFLNEDKEEISYLRIEMSKTDQDIILAELKKPNPGVVEITYKSDFYSDSYNKIFDEAKYVQIKSAMLSDGSESSSSSSDESYSDESDTDESDSYSSTSTSSSSNDWDEILDSYSEYVDEYIALMKKASKGDASAMANYPALLEKAQDYSNKLSNAKNDMTAAQIARYTKITAKMTKAAM